jgi:hypothetical protein
LAWFSMCGLKVRHLLSVSVYAEHHMQHAHLRF